VNNKRKVIDELTNRCTSMITSHSVKLLDREHINAVTEEYFVRLCMHCRITLFSTHSYIFRDQYQKEDGGGAATRIWHV
jgi:hypothetical protein